MAEEAYRVRYQVLREAYTSRLEYLKQQVEYNIPKVLAEDDVLSTLRADYSTASFVGPRIAEIIDAHLGEATEGLIADLALRLADAVAKAEKLSCCPSSIQPQLAAEVSQLRLEYQTALDAAAKELRRVSAELAASQDALKAAQSEAAAAKAKVANTVSEATPMASTTDTLISSDAGQTAHSVAESARTSTGSEASRENGCARCADLAEEAKRRNYLRHREDKTASAAEFTAVLQNGAAAPAAADARKSQADRRYRRRAKAAEEALNATKLGAAAAAAAAAAEKRRLEVEVRRLQADVAAAAARSAGQEARLAALVESLRGATAMGSDTDGNASTDGGSHGGVVGGSREFQALAERLKEASSHISQLKLMLVAEARRSKHAERRAAAADAEVGSLRTAVARGRQELESLQALSGRLEQLGEGTMASLAAREAELAQVRSEQRQLDNDEPWPWRALQVVAAALESELAIRLPAALSAGPGKGRALSQAEVAEAVAASASLELRKALCNAVERIRLEVRDELEAERHATASGAANVRGPASQWGWEESSEGRRLSEDSHLSAVLPLPGNDALEAVEGDAATLAELRRMEAEGEMRGLRARAAAAEKRAAAAEGAAAATASAAAHQAGSRAAAAAARALQERDEALAAAAARLEAERERCAQLSRRLEAEAAAHGTRIADAEKRCGACRLELATVRDELERSQMALATENAELRRLQKRLSENGAAEPPSSPQFAARLLLSPKASAAGNVG